jgi:hypothetical protein
MAASPLEDPENNNKPTAATNKYLVNKHGYPKGKGKYQPEKRGPYSYVLCIVQQAHYEENEVFWTVIREDNGDEIRGDARRMEPISTQEGLLAAQRAAETSRSIYEDFDNEVREENQKKSGVVNFLSGCLCVTFCFPLICVYECMVTVKESKAYGSLLRQAKLFLKGSKPYNISFRITSKNLIVILSIWYLFIDQIRLAFLPPSADTILAYVNFVVWLILVAELLLEVFVRPNGWCALVRSEKAFTPQTARYINGVHLLVESISLVFFVPVFYCIFDSNCTCSSRTNFSFYEATLAAQLGPTISRAFYGRLFYGIVRLRVFALVRHWRNFWLKNTFLNEKKYRKRRERQRLALLDAEGDEKSTGTTNTTDEYDEIKSARHIVPYGEKEYRDDQQDDDVAEDLEQKGREQANFKAINIGTALMSVNSHRAFFLFCFLTACFPMLLLINMQNVFNPEGQEMVEYLQAINFQDADDYTGADSSIDCAFLYDSVEAWSTAMTSPFGRSTTIPRSEDNNGIPSSRVISVSIRPPRCYDFFTNKTIGNLNFSVGGNCPPWSWSQETYTGGCIYGTAANISADTTSLSSATGPGALPLRVGSLATFESIGTTANSTFAVSVTYNYTQEIGFAARQSFVLELVLLATIIGMLLRLRADTVNMVFGSFQSMLRIVSRYAKNPLAPSGSDKSHHYQMTDRNSSIGSRSSIFTNGTEDEDFIRTYETEQLHTAFTKITDLLRKCWGVAGADIISSNLASIDGDYKVFNPTVPGRNVFALFAFAAITDFDYALKNLGGDVMILINDVASVLHGEVYRWGLGDSGQCNRNLGSAFLMVFKIGSVMEVMEKLEEATRVVWRATGKKQKQRTKDRRKLIKSSSTAQVSTTTPDYVKGLNKVLRADKDVAMEAMAEATKVSLGQIPGISSFADRAVIGMLKSFANIHRDTQLRAWSRDFRLTNSTVPADNAWSVNMTFGMDAGWAVEGAVGSEYKIDATYLSPHVNMSSRMMSACKQYGVSILLSQAVHELLSEPARAKMRNIDRVTVKGSSKIQKIYTYDARARGTYLFLYGVSDDQADQQAKNYDPRIWNVDLDLKAMRHHVTEDFEEGFQAGMKAYYDGDWPTAIAKLERANDIMVEAAMDEGNLEQIDTINNSTEREELYRKELSDQPSKYLINFMKSKGGKAPDDWDGWHPLFSK